MPPYCASWPPRAARRYLQCLLACARRMIHAAQACTQAHVHMPLRMQALGGTVGHCMATGMAVVGGSFISKYFSERVIGLVGGVLFLVFALTTLLGLF